MTTKTLKTKSAALTATAIAVITAATLLSAPAAMATLKTRTKSNQANERAVASGDAAIVEQEMTRCATGKMVFSWGSNDRGEIRSQSEIDFPNDRKTLDTVTTNAEGNRGQVALCSALQKATMAINADPEKLSALNAKVSLQDFHFVRQMLVDNGVPVDLLDDPADASAKEEWDLATSKGNRTIAGGDISPLVIKMSWPPKGKFSAGGCCHVTLIK